MTKTFKILLSLFVTIFMLSGPSFAQIKIQVVTRTISKIFIYKPGNTFEIKAEKASIRVIKSTDNTIKVKLQLISKNPSKQTAEVDLKYCNYQITESNDLILVSNFFNSKDQFKEISSNLSAKYEIEVPSGIDLKLKNIYGNIDMNEVKGNFNISLDFCQLKLTNIDGTLFINSNYSDINGQKIQAVTNIQAQKAEITIVNTGNLLKIRNQYGSIKLDDINAPTDIYGEMTDIELSVDNPKKYSFDFTATNGEISLSREYTKMITNNKDEARFIGLFGKISLKIRTSYNTITLNTK